MILATIEVNAPVHKHSVIWLHGLGADGSDFVPMVSELNLPNELGVRFIFPHAPVQAITMNQGYQMRAWFDIYEMSLSAEIDELGISNSVKQVEHLIAQETAKGISTSEIILAGFSQGAVIALTTGLTHAKKLGGIIALSGYLPLAEKVIINSSEANKDIPIFIAHGTDDNVLPYALGKNTYVALENAGYPVDWHSYVMNHSVCSQEIQDIKKWLQDIYAKTKG